MGLVFKALETIPFFKVRKWDLKAYESRWNGGVPPRLFLFVGKF